jgi:hypothetical protein
MHYSFKKNYQMEKMIKQFDIFPKSQNYFIISDAKTGRCHKENGSASLPNDSKGSGGKT